jgi:glutamate decarboxylase
MLYGRKNRSEFTECVIPEFGTIGADCNLPKYKFNEEGTSPKTAYRIIENELLADGTARQNLATFCQTIMGTEVTQLMGANLEKNAIDKSQYPHTAELENRCVNILADLWNVSGEHEFAGTSTVGSSEACMLGGLAMKFRWRKRAEAAGIDINKQLPNLVVPANYQICWQKFCVYWDIEMRVIPAKTTDLRLDIDEAIKNIDDYTIGVVAVLGSTYTGAYDDVKKLDELIGEFNQTAKVSVPIHVDAASGGFYAPFVTPDLEWDFRLDNVISINASGHKYGLVYPGIGWLVWKDIEYLPRELVFHVSYLGGEMPSMQINFSRSASHIIGQYFMFLRLGKAGYKRTHEHEKAVAMFISRDIEKLGDFEIISDGSEGLPVVCYKLKENGNEKWSLYDLSDRLQMNGWQVPTYPLAKNMEDIAVHRIVIRADFAMNMAEEFVESFRSSVKELSEAEYVMCRKPEFKKHGFVD